jgi:thioredoxin reductase (NADPH)
LFVGIDGNEFIDAMTKQAERFGTEFKFGEVVDVDTSSRPFKVITADKEVILTKSVIIATGARARKLGLPSEQTYWSKGVTSCATCDGFFYKGQEVCVIGGGDSACEEALFLTRMCSKVYLIHRRDTFRASKIMFERAASNPKIELVLNSEVVEVCGGQEGKVRLWIVKQLILKVNGVTVKNVQTGENKLIPLKGVFLGIGHIPNSEIFKGKLDLDDEGFVLCYYT